MSPQQILEQVRHRRPEGPAADAHLVANAVHSLRMVLDPDDQAELDWLKSLLSGSRC